MVTKQPTKLSEGVNFAEFAKLINKSKSYVSQLKTANRLVLSEDGKRVLVEESKTRIKATSDPAKWPLTLYHEAERKLKSEVKSEPVGLPPDPYDDFMYDLLMDSRVEIVAGLMVQSGLSFHDASIAFNEVGGCLAEIRERQGYETTFADVPNPLDHRLSDEVRAQIKADIEERARELELLREEEI
jgi:hypothetical protein